jgi:hypothetical protein
MKEYGAWPLVDKIPRRFRGPVYAAATFLGVSGVAATCGGDSPQNNTPGSGNPTESAQNLDPNRFLKYPVPRDERFKIQQGWKYSFKTDTEHMGIDYIMGAIDNSDTWKTFPVMAAADGEACVNPPHREGTAVFIRHDRPGGKTYYTYYGHLNEVKGDIPQCVQGDKVYTELKHVVQGEGIGKSGSSGVTDIKGDAQPNWKHLHFGVIGPDGANIDPYDKRSTRDKYPDLLFTNNLTCGDKTLWINCPTGNSKAELVPTMSLRPTVGPVETVGVPQIPTVERKIEGEGVLKLSKWEIKINGWQELPAYSSTSPYFKTTFKEGWKRVVVKGVLFNTSGSIIYNNELEDYMRYARAYDINIESDGFKYQAQIGEVNEHPISAELQIDATNFNSSIPAGHSVAAVMIAEVPKNKENYVIEVLDSRGSQIGKSVSRGEVSATGEGALPGADKLSAQSACVLPGYATIKYSGEASFDAQTVFNGRFKEQFLAFDIKNDWGKDIDTSYYLNNFEVEVSAPGGRLMKGSQYYYAEGFETVKSVPPGVEKRVYAKISDNIHDGGINDNFINLVGSAVILKIKNSSGGISNCTWQLP